MPPLREMSECMLIAAPEHLRVRGRHCSIRENRRPRRRPSECAQCDGCCAQSRHHRAVFRASAPHHSATAAVPARSQKTARAFQRDRKSTRLNSSHVEISYAVFCLKKKKKITKTFLRYTRTSCGQLNYM